LKLTLTSLLALLCFAGSARADVVALKNGDRVTGVLVTIKGGNLQLKSEMMGDVTIPMAKVVTYSVDKPVALIIKGQQPVRGTLELAPSGDWQVKANGQTQTIAAAKVDTIMPADDYHKLYEAPSPKPWQAWKGGISLGESLQRGNQETNTTTTTLNAVRERPPTLDFERHTRANFGLTAMLSSADQTGSSITSRTLSSNLREDLLFTPTDFVFGIAQLDHISTEGLYLRQTYGGGFGKDVIKNSRTTFSLIGGMTFQHEKFFTGAQDQTGNGLVGEKFGKQFNKRIRLDHNLNFYPNFSQLGEYRFDTTTVLSLKVSNRLSLNSSLIDLYLSNPPAGNHQNNVTFSTGIGYTF
jgi:putative salt-induced outer membrane protein YdiY